MPRADFLWGVSTSAYQHEGGFNAPGCPLNNWYEWELSGRVQSSGRAVDFWNRHTEDFKLARGLGLNAFRLGISWSRVQPVRDPAQKSAPPFDLAALDAYGRMLVEARTAGLEPLVTLHHFTHPHWLGTDVWLEPETIDLYLAYVRETVTGVNQSLIARGLPVVRWWITLNEPNMLMGCSHLLGTFPSNKRHSVPSAVAAFQNLLIAHVKAYRLIHRLYEESPGWGKPMVSFNNYSSDMYWLDHVAVDVLAAPSFGVSRRDLRDWLYEQSQDFQEEMWHADIPFRQTPPYWLGQALKGLQQLIGPWQIKKYNAIALTSVLYERPAERPFDFIALDYYDPFIGHAFRFPRWEEFFMPNKNLRSWLVNTMTSKWWDWAVIPQGLRFFVRHYGRRHPTAPIILAENGIAQLRNRFQDKPWRHDGMERSDFLKMHIDEVRRLCDEGWNLHGYFHWSLTDNYEWGTYDARFGLYEVDFADPALERRELNSLGDRPARTFGQLIG